MNLRLFALLLNIFTAIILLIPLIVVPQSSPGDSVVYVNRTQDFEVKGDGSAANWNQTSWITVTHTRGAPVQYETKAKILYSATGVYCLFKCNDSKITATLKEDFLDLYNEDVVEVFFWTDEKVPMYFEYELSPLNFELPILVPNVKGDFLGWRPWHYEGERKTRHSAYIEKGQNGDTVLSWTAEFFIPFALLKPMSNVPPKPGTRWRANFYRLDYDNGQAGWTWRPTQKNFHEYERFGTLIFK